MMGWWLGGGGDEEEERRGAPWPWRAAAIAAGEVLTKVRSEQDKVL